MHKKSRVLVINSKPFIGSVIIDYLKEHNYSNVIDGPSQSRHLWNRDRTEAFFRKIKPEYVFLVAGKSVGIAGNMKFPAELMLDNLLIECNVIDAAYRYGVKKLLYLASSCCYPRFSPQPMKEEYLLSGPFEPTNEAYSLAKIAGLKLIEAYRRQYRANFICAIPASSFGPGDDFSQEDSHVIGALIRRMHEAKINDAKDVVVWGSGKPRREFIYVEDLADGCLFLMEKYNNLWPINLGYGEDLSIKELAYLIKKVVGFSGRLVFDTSKPDGMPSKLLDTCRLKKLGWRPHWVFRKALQKTYDWFVKEGIAG